MDHRDVGVALDCLSKLRVAAVWGNNWSHRFAGKESETLASKYAEEVCLKIVNGDFSCVAAMTARRNQLSDEIVLVPDMSLHVIFVIQQVLFVLDTEACEV